MELFAHGKVVRLKSRHGKFLYADEDELQVTQHQDGSSPGAWWEVEPLPHAVRLRSRYGRYLAASSQPFLLGMTARKVLQSSSADASVEWEPVRDGLQLRLMSRGGGDTYLRANGGLLPWRNSVTHDVPHRAATQEDWLLWDVEVVQVLTPGLASSAPTSVLAPDSPPAPKLRPEHHLPTESQTTPPEPTRISNLESSNKIDMELSPISASLGAMGSLPRKLDELLATKHRALRGILMDEIDQLTADLCILYNFMLKLSDAPQDPPMTARYWMKDVRELSYDMEDFADQFVQSHGRAKIPRAIHRKNKTISRVKIDRLPKRRKWRPGTTDKISEFRSRAYEAIQRYWRYKFDDCASNPGYSRIGRGRPTILPDPDDLFGIEGPTNELERWLINGEEQLKVVSIVGVAGIGKTTLALKLWGKLRGQFECGAFVRTAQKPDMRGILRNILLQVRPHQPPNHGEMRHLINDLREYLQDKRYFVIIDDLWATSVWDVVSRAFPKSGCSRIITMTEIMEVALACCAFCPEHIYKMESLSDNDSEKLLLQRIRVSGNQSPLQFDDVIPQIIRSCGGLPLAIIIVARILASQPEKLEQWGSTQNSFDYIFGANTTMEGFMGTILNICFISLPHYLKTCLLHLSTYPEGYLFLKDDLVKQWVAEDFICANEGEDLKEVAGSYFDELVSMGLIQVMDINCDYELLSYSVHQLVLDLITYKSIEENFITVVDYSQTTILLADKVRRLSLHFGSATYATTPASTGLSQVRSLFFSGLFNCMPSFVVFKLLRVLILHFWDDTGTKMLNLTGICELFRLRYLQVTCNVTVKLPDKIAAMEHLETLEIKARVLDIPPDIVRLSSLLHLGLRGANLPSGIGCIRSLRTLMYFDLGNSSEDNLWGLGELTNLRDLHLTYSSSLSSEHLKRNLIALVSSLGKLCNLKYLTLAAGTAGTVGTVVHFDGSSGHVYPIFLERLELLPPICIFSRLPKWIGQLRKICIMKVAVRKLPMSDIAILTGLPSLTVLSLSVQTAPEGRIVFSDRAFPVLMYFKFRCGVLCMSFMAGAMPNLCRLKLGFNAHIGEKFNNMLAGIEHLLNLQDIAGQIGATTESEWRAAESAINDAINKHPRFPRRNLQWVDPVEEECCPSEKHNWSQEKGSLGEKHGVLEKANDMNKHADSGLSQLPNLPSTVASGRLKSVSLVEVSKELPASSLPSKARLSRVHEPFAWESTEFLRKLCIGKEVTFRVDFTAPNMVHEFGTVYRGDKNVGYTVVASGLARVKEQGPKGGEQNPYLAELQRLEEVAKQQGLGHWSKEPGVAEESIRDLPPSAALLSFMGRMIQRVYTPRILPATEIQDGPSSVIVSSLSAGLGDFAALAQQAFMEVAHGFCFMHAISRSFFTKMFVQQGVLKLFIHPLYLNLARATSVISQETAINSHQGCQLTEMEEPAAVTEDLPFSHEGYQIPPLASEVLSLESALSATLHSAHDANVQGSGLGLSPASANARAQNIFLKSHVQNMMQSSDPTIKKGRKGKQQVPEDVSNRRRRRSSRSSKYDGFRFPEVKVKPRIVPSAKPSLTLHEDAEPSANAVLPPTPIPTLQHVGVNLCGVPASELSPKKLLASLQTDESSST